MWWKSFHYSAFVPSSVERWASGPGGDVECSWNLEEPLGFEEQKSEEPRVDSRVDVVLKYCLLTRGKQRVGLDVGVCIGSI